MKRAAIWTGIALLLALFASCGRDGVIRDTASGTGDGSPVSENETVPRQSETGAQSSGTGRSGTAPSETGTGNAGTGETASETETETDGGTKTENEAESETDLLSGIIGGFFDMTRDKILESRGESGALPPDHENSLSYGDRYARFAGSSLYDFDEKGRLSGISLSFGKDHTLEEIADAVTRMNPGAVTQNGSTVWTEGDIVYTLSEGENGPVLTIRKGV